MQRPRTNVHNISRLLAVFFILFGLPLSAPAQEKHGWKLQQRSDFWGEQISYVAPDMLVMTAPKLGLRFFMRSPDWFVTGLNDRTHSYTIVSYDQWTHDVFGTASTKEMPMTLGRKGTVGGWAAQEYLVDCGTRESLKVNVPGLIKNGQAYNTKIWVTKDIPAPRELSQFLSMALQVPVSAGTPLQAVQYDSAGRSFTSFETLGSEKCVMPLELFKVPPGYRKVASEVALVFTDEGDQSLPQSDGTVETCSVFKGWVPGDNTTITAKRADRFDDAQKGGCWVPGD